jgi:hypothetical protein
MRTFACIVTNDFQTLNKEIWLLNEVVTKMAATDNSNDATFDDLEKLYSEIGRLLKRADRAVLVGGAVSMALPDSIGMFPSTEMFPSVGMFPFLELAQLLDFADPYLKTSGAMATIFSKSIVKGIYSRLPCDRSRYYCHMMKIEDMMTRKKYTSALVD